MQDLRNIDSAKRIDANRARLLRETTTSLRRCCMDSIKLNTMNVLINVRRVDGLFGSSGVQINNGL